MLRGIKGKYEKYHNISIPDSVLETAVRLSVRYIGDRSLPDKAIDLLDEASALLKISGDGKGVLTDEQVSLAAERRTGIPLGVLTEGETERLKNLEIELNKRVIGQEKAINLLAPAVRRARAGVRCGGRPNGSFLFAGRAGVGKTECAKALAELVYNTEKSFIRLDMSEFSEPHSVSKLIGAPPGYVGYGESCPLTERVRRCPYSLVLFDEIEKSHPDVRALLLQILDEGKLTDSTGLAVNFENTLIILTANCNTGAGIGFGEKDCFGDVGKMFSAELMDRLDEVVTFLPLSKENLCAVADVRLEGLQKVLASRGIDVEFSSDFSLRAVELSKSQSARAVARTAVRLGEEAAAELVLEKGFKKGETATLFVENGRGFAKIKQKSY